MQLFIPVHCKQFLEQLIQVKVKLLKNYFIWH